MVMSSSSDGPDPEAGGHTLDIADSSLESLSPRPQGDESPHHLRRKLDHFGRHSECA